MNKYTGDLTEKEHQDFKSKKYQYNRMYSDILEDFEGEYEVLKVTGLNGFEFIVEKTSVEAERFKKSNVLGVKIENIKINYPGFFCAIYGKDFILNKIQILIGTINSTKLATENQKYFLSRHIINKLRNPAFPVKVNINEIA